MWSVLAVSMVLVASVAPQPQAEAATSCSKVATALKPCRTFVLHGGAAPPSSCCQGLKSLYTKASAADRQLMCSCLKYVSGSASSIAIGNAALLPSKCGVSIPYKISPSTDCATYVTIIN